MPWSQLLSSKIETSNHSSTLRSDNNRHVLEHLDELDPQHEFHKPGELDEKSELAYWFSLTDTDGDGEIDGYELLMALNDGLDETNGIKLEEAIQHVDEIFAVDDLNGK